MATFRKQNSGYRAEVARKGRRKSKVLPTLQQAKDWAARAEFEILHSDKVAAQTPFGDVLDRYAREVSPAKKGHRWEVVRLEKIQRDKIACISLGELNPKDLADYRDRRLREVTGASVRREMVLLSSVFNVARKEWGLMSENPLQDVRKPPQSAARDRLPSAEEIERMLYVASGDLTKATARAFHAFLFAGETAMRAGEIVGLTWDLVDLDRKVATLPVTKNGTSREVPLSSAAIELLRDLPKQDPVFGLTSRQLDVLFRKSRDTAGVDDLTFHDSRHYAITRLAKKLDVMDLARMVGHRNLSQLLTYYNESAENLAQLLD